MIEGGLRKRFTRKLDAVIHLTTTMSQLISIRIDGDLLDDVDDLAEERNLNRTQLITDLCEDATQDKGGHLLSSDGR